MSLSSLSIPSFPDVPNVPGVPTVLRNPQAAIGSLVNSAENVAIGAAQGIIGGAAAAVGQGIAAVNGAISNIQNLTGGSLGDIGSLVSGGLGDPGSLLSGDSSSSEAGGSESFSPTWAIYLAGTTTPLIVADSFKVFDYRQDWRLPNYPMEQGAFQSYNKVQTPFEGRIELTKGRGKTNSSAINKFLNDIEAAANSTNLYDIAAGDLVYSNISIKGYNYRRTNLNGVSLLTVELVVLEIRLAPAATFTNTASPNGADSVSTGQVQAVPLTTGPNLTNGEPTSSAQFATGNADAQSLSPAAASADPNAVQAATNTQTPAVQDTAPNAGLPSGQTAPSATPAATPATIPYAEIDSKTNMAPSDGPFSDVDGNPVSASQLSSTTPTGVGYSRDPHSGLVYATSFNSDGTQNTAVVSRTLSQKYM